MNTEQPTQEKRDEDRMRQIEKDLCALHWQISNIEERLCFVIERLRAAKLYTFATVLTDTVAPSY